MSRAGWAFVAGFVLAAAAGAGLGLHQEARAALARVKHEAALAAGAERLRTIVAELEVSRARAARLAVDSGRLAGELVVRQAAAEAGLLAVRQLAQLRREAGDSAAAGELERAAVAVEGERRACSLFVQNCEARAANANAARTLAERELGRTAADLYETGRLWRDAERRAQPSFFRDIWRSRALTLPLLATVVVLFARR